MVEKSRKPGAEKSDAAPLGPADAPVKPVRDFDPEKADGNRRMFQNGDTDRSPGEASDRPPPRS